MGRVSVGLSKRSSAVKSKRPLTRKWSEPDWQAEVVRDTSALWRIVVMAGNLAPYKRTRDLRISADGAWAHGYLKLLNVMKDALTSDPTNTDRIYYNLDNAGNAERVKNHGKLSEVRVDTLSALKFIARCYGMESMPAGMSQLLAIKQSRLPQSSSPESVKAKKHGSAALEPKKRTQDNANETKASTRLKALLFATLLWQENKSAGQGRDPKVQAKVLKSLQEVIDEYGFYRAQGFGEDGFKTLTKDWCEAFYQMLASRKPEKADPSGTHMSPPSVS